jgi:hypothetical protein
MFRKANIKLTLIYSSLFLVSFWAFSIGLYAWMEHSFEDSYTGEVEQQGEVELDEHDMDIVNIAVDVALDRLKNTLILFNSAMIVIVPVIAWLMTRRTLAPVQHRSSSSPTWPTNSELPFR